MSTRKSVWLALAPVVSLALAAAAWAQSPASRLATFEQGGTTYFALSMMSGQAADPQQKNDVVVLFDTSASQAGKFRDDGLAALNAMLAGLGPTDRVHLMAVDVRAIPLTAGFVAPAGPEMQAALAKLTARTPLGATDLPQGLLTAAASFTESGAARTVVYIGDGMSKARLLTGDSLANLVRDLRGNQVSVSSYVIGMERNVQLLAALANHTGGFVQVDSDAASAPVTSGQVLAGSVHGSVIWPAETTVSDNVEAVYPVDMPPLRTDRDSILIGTLSSPGPVHVAVSGTMNGRPVELSWSAAPERPSEDFAFLPKLVDLARSDRGMSLPTVGSGGLREAGLATLASAQRLTQLGEAALSSGNFAGAARVAEAALERDPNNPEARAIRSAATRGAAGAAPLDADLRLSGADAALAGGGLLEEVLAEERGFLGRVDEERRVLAGMMRTQVERDLAEARRVMGESPEIAEQNLKLVLQTIESAPELDAEVRMQLRQQVENAIRESRRLAVEVADRIARAREAEAIAVEMQRVSDALELQDQQLKQIMDRFDALMAEGRYQVADDEVSPEVERLAPNTTIESSVVFGGRMTRSFYENQAVWRAREKNFLQTMFQVELAYIPFPDEPPIVYPAAEQWEDLTIRRRKYSAVDLAKQGGSEERIFQELNKTTDLDFVETPLKDAIDFLAIKHEIPIVLDEKRLIEAGLGTDTPVTKSLKGVTLRSALRLMLQELELTYVVRDEVLKITTPEEAEMQLITKVYPVGDLVVPIGAGGGMGGMGGMMGGGMGMGMGGGMGGMGGGMGGMGGGMGGMGGGMFAVEEELTLGTKKIEPSRPATPAAAPQAEAKVRRPASARKAEAIVLQPAEGESLAQAWDRYFAEQKAQLLAQADGSTAFASLMASVRETVRQFMAQQNYSEIPVMIQAALRHGHVAPWMYESIALAIRAEAAEKKTDIRESEELERALLSAVDLAASEEQVLIVAAYMASIGLHERALSLYQQIGDANPSLPQPFIQGLELAKRLNDLEAIKWGVVGVLSHAWTGEHQHIGDEAYRTGKATYEQLLAEGRTDEAEAFDAALRRATQRDVIVRVEWTGEADIDLSVEEPSGSLVSQREPRSTSGGVHLGDASAGDRRGTAKAYSETYICPQGFSGKYRAYIKNVWGRPTSGKVTVEVYTNFGSQQQGYKRDQIALSDIACVQFDLDEGRRADPLPEAQVANVAKVQNAVNRTILAQQLANLGESEASQNFSDFLEGNGFIPFFRRRGAVGYRPMITQLPEGAMFSTNAVISADRRYVRVSPSPFFSQIGEVNTFNFVTGQGQQQQPGGGGIGGGGLF